MPDWTRSEKTVTTVMYRVPTREPWGAVWTEVAQALNAAIAEYNERFPAAAAHDIPSDDSIRIHAEDEEIVISFEKAGG